ncbi:uncharacterized protein [Halyomorpha halys]|uniref:uncharacterized protein n=1 Tax=Halyomorpha halys TaxID=286706 RepID=UPI0006D4D7B0|nr:mannose-6-phosphate isomerase [Halyomorpha halys]
MELKGVLLSQPWGMCGLEGLAAQLYVSVQNKHHIDPAIPFGEYIIGGDKFYETYVETKDKYINELFRNLTAQELGETAFCEFGGSIPFTIKILSLRIPAPLLCYPSEVKGNLFHSKNAKNFLTPGVRHGMVVALDDFIFLVGFRSLDFIIKVLENVPEFRMLVNETLIDKFLKTKEKQDFLTIFKHLLDNPSSQIEYASKILKDKLLNSAPSCIGSFHPMKLFEKLVDDNPGDVGIFLPYFLNIVNLKSLEAMIIPAETPYVYLYGEALQCSNTVENSATAAFCSRRDLDSFCDSMNLHFWTTKEIKDNLAVDIRSVEEGITEYLTPSPFYRVVMGTISGPGVQSIPRLLSFSIVLIIEGDGMVNDHLRVVPGAAYLFFKREKIIFKAVENICFVQVSINLLV